LFIFDHIAQYKKTIKNYVISVKMEAVGTLELKCFVFARQHNLFLLL